MVAQNALEVSFLPANPNAPLAIPEHERQATEVHTDKVRVGRGLGRASFRAVMPLEHQSSEIWDVFVNGYTATGRVYEPIADANAQLGKNSVSIDVSRGNAITDLLQPWHMLRAERYQQHAISSALDEIQRVHGVKHFNLKGHSMGGRGAFGLAEQEPERTAGVTLISAAGLEDHNLRMMIEERLPEFFHEEFIPNIDVLRERFGDDVGVVLDYIWHNGSNLVRTLVEGISVANADIRHRIVRFSHKNTNTRVSILNAASDKLIKNTHVAASLSDHVDYVGIHPNTDIGHLGPQTHPYEMAAELHHIDEIVDPTRVFTPRTFSVAAMARTARARRSAFRSAYLRSLG